MELDAIAVYVKVVEAGSFSGAARLLNMPKTTVSAKVAGLEKRLGVILIQRTTRKLHVTEAGAQYFQHCAAAVREIELGEAALVSSKNTPTGSLKITAPVDFGHTLLPKIVHRYLEAYPGTSVEIVLTNQMSDLVGEGIDLAIRAGRLKDSSLIAKRFFDLETRMLASAAYLAGAPALQHPRDLAKHRLLGHASTKTLRMTSGKIGVDIAFASRVITDDFEAIKALLIEGEGIGYLPDFLAAEAIADGRLVAVLPKWKMDGVGGFYFVYPGRKYSSPKLKAFMEMAVEVVNMPA